MGFSAYWRSEEMSQDEGGKRSWRYAVFVLQHEGPASVELHDVGAAGDIEADINASLVWPNIVCCLCSLI